MLKKGTLALLSALFFATVLTGCNTMHGVGEDVSAGGQAIQRGADR